VFGGHGSPLTARGRPASQPGGLKWHVGPKIQAWRVKWIRPSPTVAFHSGYMKDSPDVADGTASALEGAYLREIGISVPVIAALIGHDPKSLASANNSSDAAITFEFPR
jgi:hypothetical protein